MFDMIFLFFIDNYKFFGNYGCRFFNIYVVGVLYECY